MASDRRMDAYYYGFDATGCDPVDILLSAVACAGKAFHHTDQWREKSRVYNNEHRGDTPEARMQNAANDAAQAFKDAVEKARAEGFAAGREAERMAIYAECSRAAMNFDDSGDDGEAETLRSLQDWMIKRGKCYEGTGAAEKEQSE